VFDMQVNAPTPH